MSYLIPKLCLLETFQISIVLAVDLAVAAARRVLVVGTFGRFLVSSSV